MEDNWQTTRSTIKERNQYVYNNTLFSDVEFAVVNSKGDTVTIPAHKYVLAICSPVFQAMFFSDLAETSRTISLPDCTAEGLLELFRYMYYDEVDLTEENLVDVIYLATKYIIPLLVEKCVYYLQNEIQPEYIFGILNEIEKLEDETLKNGCWKIVDTETQKAVTSETFMNVTQERLCDIFERDSLEITELELFQAVNRWAENKIQEQELDEGGQNKRAVLGDKVIQLIRFPLMTMDEFSENVLPTEILNVCELTEMFRYYNSKGVKSLLKVFNATERRGLPCIQDSCVRRKSQWYSPWLEGLGLEAAPTKQETVKQYSATFTTNKHIYLTGVRLLGYKKTKGGAKTAEGAVNISIYKKQELLLDHDEKYRISAGEPVTVELGKSVYVPPDTEYTIQIIVNGPMTLHEDIGKASIKCKNVTFHFRECTSRRDDNITKDAFPSLLFHQFCKTTPATPKGGINYN